MIVHLVDNISYARELFIEHKRIENLGEHVIEKSVLDTILSLLCTGYVPEDVNVNFNDKSIAELEFPKVNIGLSYYLYGRNLASYVLVKNFKIKIKEEKIIISNINVSSLLKLISSGTQYNNISCKGNNYVLSY